MKNKVITLVTVLLLLLLNVGCSGDEDNNIENNENKFIIDVNNEIQPRKPIENINKGEGDADVDLTILSSTMVFGEVFNITVYPEEYMGKTIKIRGEYYSHYDDQTDNNYFFVIITDAAACCAEGLEFSLSDDYTYPEDYPEDGEQIEFVGVFDKYEELGNTYYYLLVDEISII